MVSKQYSEAMVETLDILNNTENEIIDKIPKKLLEFWEENKSKTYKPILDHSKPINEMNIKEQTKAMIAMIYLNYLCDDKEKADLKLILQENEQKYQEELREKYNSNNLFKQPEQKSAIANSTQLIEIKNEPWYKKLSKKISSFFTRIFKFKS